MKKIREWLVTDWWLKIISLVIAFLLWFVVVQVKNPTGDVTFSNIQLTYKNIETLADNNLVFELEGSDKVKVKVSAPKSVIDALTADDIVAEVDLSSVTESGTVTLPVTYRVISGDNIGISVGVDSVEGSVSNVTISAEVGTSKYVSVSVMTTGTVADGYVLGDVVSDQNMMEISGPASEIDMVSYAGVTVNVSNASSVISTNIEVKLYDNSGRELTSLRSVTMQTDYIHVSADILTTKTVNVVVSKTGTPAEGYIYNNSLVASPTSIRVAGSTESLATLARISITDPIDISKADSDVTEIFDITDYLPSGIRLVDESDKYITVTAGIEEVQYETFYIPVDNVTITGIPEKTIMYVSPVMKEIPVVISGLASELATVDPTELRVTVDADEYFTVNKIKEINPDIYYMPIKVDLNGSLNLNEEVTIPIALNSEDNKNDKI